MPRAMQTLLRALHFRTHKPSPLLKPQAGRVVAQARQPTGPTPNSARREHDIKHTPKPLRSLIPVRLKLTLACW